MRRKEKERGERKRKGKRKETESVGEGKGERGREGEREVIGLRRPAPRTAADQQLVSTERLSLLHSSAGLSGPSQRTALYLYSSSPETRPGCHH